MKHMGAHSKRDLCKDTLMPMRCRKPSTAPAVAAIPATKAKRVRSGPCFFGHPSTSGRDRKRMERWNVCPSPSPWPSLVQAGETLCQRCYQLHIRAKAKSIPCPLPAGTNYDEIHAANFATEHKASSAMTSSAAASSSAYTGRPPGSAAPDHKNFKKSEAHPGEVQEHGIH